MEIPEVIKSLLLAKEGSNSLDAQIAMVLGAERRVQNIRDPRTGVSRLSASWVDSGTGTSIKIPRYTSNLDHAFELCHKYYPALRIGFSWEKGAASATVGDERKFVQAATPAIAICIAFLVKLRSDRIVAAANADIEE